ncbi:MAG: hypothetical protein ACI94Y_002987 [Maribacter sp.]|jgi:hypothetical protein
MNNRFLLNNRFQTPGLILFILGLILAVLSYSFQEIPFFDVHVFAIWIQDLGLGTSDSNHFLTIIENNIFNEITATFLIIGGIFFAFSKEKNEDEFINRLRLDALLIATYINYGLLLFATLFIYDMAFFHVLIYNMFTLLIIFIVRFRYVLYQSKK